MFMKKSGKFFPSIFITILLFAVCGFIFADNAKDDLMQAIGPRAVGMGGAFSAVADDYSAFYWNPAGLVLANRQNANIFFDSIFKNTQDDLGFNYTYPVSDLITTAATYRRNIFMQSGETDNMLYLSCAGFIDESNMIAMGANIKLLGIGFNDSDVSGGMSSVDLGIMVFPDIWDKKARFSFFIQDVDSYINWSDNLQEKVPVLYKLGASYRPDKSLVMASDFDVTHYGTGQGYDKREINLGAEKWFLNEIIGNFAFRAGYYWEENGSQPFKFTFGLSYSREDFKVDYAYIPDFEQMGETHKLAVTYFTTHEKRGKAEPQQKEIKPGEIKIIMEKLKDVEFTALQKYFSPLEGSSHKNAEFSVTNVPAGTAGIQWKTDIINADGKKVFDFGGNDTPPEKLFWDGTDSAKQKVPDGDYTAKFSILYNGQQVFEKARVVSVSTVAPEAQLVIFPQVFAPGTKSSANKLQMSIDSRDKDINTWSISITDKKNTLVKSFTGEGAGGKITWDGKDSKGALIKNGAYIATLSLENYAGNKYESQATFDADNIAVTLSDTTEKKIFKIGRENIKIGVNFTNANKVSKLDLKIFDMDGNLVDKIDAKSVAEKSIDWDGKNLQSGFAREGNIYKYRIGLTQKNGIVLQKDGYCETALPDFKAFGMKLMLAAVLFPKQDKSIPLDDYQSLNQAADAIKQYAKNYYIFIRGYADDFDDADKNLTLSIERALAVKDYLVTGQKIPETNIYIMGAGDGEYIDTAAKEDAKKKGPRVEVELMTK